MYIELKNANKAFGNNYAVQALNNVSLSVDKGEWLTIMGPSGSGKTTLLNIIGGMEKLDDGKVEIDGQLLSSFSEDELQKFRRNTIGFIFQHYQLFEQYSVLENVMIPQWPYKPYATIEEQAKKILSQLHMGERMDHLPGELSGGETANSNCPSANADEPDHYFVIEPTGNLDAENRENIMELLKELHLNGMTIILVTHDAEVVKYGNRQFQLRDGVLKEITRTTENTKVNLP